jgi:adenylate kinase
VQRDDDTEEAVGRRLEAYENDTVPILDYYRVIGKRVRVVDGVGHGDLVFGRLITQIDSAVLPS